MPLVSQQFWLTTIKTNYNKAQRDGWIKDGKSNRPE